MVSLTLCDATLQIDRPAQPHVARLRIRGGCLESHGSLAGIQGVLVAGESVVQLGADIVGEGQRVPVGLEAGERDLSVCELDTQALQLGSSLLDQARVADAFRPISADRLAQ